MWTKNRRKLYLASVLLSLSCALWSPAGPATVWAAGAVEEAPIAISQQQKDRLVRLLNEQQTDLITLQAKLDELKKQAGTSQEQYQTVGRQLDRAQAQLATLQMDLMKSKKSLTDAQKEIENLRRSLAALEVQIEHLQAENRQLKKSNRILKISLAIAGGALIGAVASK